MQETERIRATGTLYAHVPAAGIHSSTEGGGVASSLRQDTDAATPRQEAKYRHSSWQPGQRVRHFGVADDAIPEGPYGTTKGGRDRNTTAESMRQRPDSSWSTWKQEYAESAFAGQKRQPLGHGYTRGQQIPEGLGSTIPFGKPLHALELDRSNQGKDTIFPASKPWSSSQDPQNPKHEMYIKSHGAFAAGEQRNRHYNWSATGVDPSSHTFGSPSNGPNSNAVSRGLREAMTHNSDEPIANARHAEYAASHAYHLGKPKLLPCADRTLPADYTFGSTKQRTDLHAGERVPIAASTSNPDDVDASLGKSIREGWKNSEVPDRVFGISSIRRDISPPSNLSLANTVTYGNGATMEQIMHPRKACMAADQFQALRSADEIRQLLEDNNIPMSKQAFDQTYKAAAAVDRSSDQCTLATFLQQRQQS